MRMGGCVNRFFSGGLSKMDELLINNSFSVEQAISFSTVAVVSNKAVALLHI